MSPRIHVAALAAVLSLSMGGSVSADGPNDVLPDGPGKDVVVRVCTSCHEAAQIARKARAPDDWDYEIGKMISGGAELTPEEQDAVYAYLVKNFSPKTAPTPASDAKAPSGR